MPKALMSVPNTEDSGQYLAVLFCIPDTPDWRQATAALISNFTYGRAYDTDTTNVKLAQEIGRRIFDSMTMCDLETSLLDIANSLQVIADNTPRLYTIQEVLDLTANPGGIDFEQIESFLNILGVLPGIRIDPLKYILEWIWKSQTLSNMYAQSTAQNWIAGSLSKGLGIEAILGGIDVADTATDEILDIINGTSNVLQTLFSGIELLRDENSGSTLKVMNDIVINLEICPVCGQSGCNCNPELDGQIVAQTPMIYDPCQYPDVFERAEDYKDYICNWANYVADKLGIGIKQFQLLHNRFFYDYIALSQQERLGVMEVYQKMAKSLDQLVDPLLMATLTNLERSEIITELANHYLLFQQDVITTVPETATIDEKVDEYFDQPFGPVSTYWEANKDTLIQDLYEAETNPEVIATVLDFTSDAIGASLSGYAALIGDTLSKIANDAMANLRGEKIQTIWGYEPSFQCSGEICTCPEFWVTDGLYLGGGVFQGENTVLNPGLYQLDVHFNYDLNAAPGQRNCGPNVMVTVNNVTGWSFSGPGSFRLYDVNQVEIYCSDQQPPPWSCCHALSIFSATEFTAEILIYQGDCTEGGAVPC